MRVGCSLSARSGRWCVGQVNFMCRCECGGLQYLYWIFLFTLFLKFFCFFLWFDNYFSTYPCFSYRSYFVYLLLLLLNSISYVIKYFKIIKNKHVLPYKLCVKFLGEA